MDIINNYEISKEKYEKTSKKYTYLSEKKIEELEKIVKELNIKIKKKKGRKITKTKIINEISKYKKKIKNDFNENKKKYNEFMKNRPKRFTTHEMYIDHIEEINSDDKIKKEYKKFDIDYQNKGCNKEYGEYKKYERENKLKPLTKKSKCNKKNNKKENIKIKNIYITAKLKRKEYAEKCVIDKKYSTEVDKKITDNHKNPINKYDKKIKDCEKIIN